MKQIKLLCAHILDTRYYIKSRIIHIFRYDAINRINKQTYIYDDEQQKM